MQLVFVHVPKAAGMCLHYAIETAFGIENTLRVGNQEQYYAFHDMSDDDLRGKAYIGGHFPYTEIYQRLGDAPRYFTVLRDPVSRFLSAYHYISSWSEHPSHSQVAGKGLGHYLRLEADALNSTMCRQVSDQVTADGAMAVLRTKYWKFVTVRGLGALAQSIGTAIGQPLRVDRHNETPGFGKVMLDSRELDLLAEITREDRKLFEMVAEAEQNDLL
jgi:hypothetical protein